MPDEPRNPYDESDPLDDDLFGCAVVSSTEMTGLIPARPADEGQARAYGQIARIPRHKKGGVPPK